MQLIVQKKLRAMLPAATIYQKLKYISSMPLPVRPDFESSCLHISIPIKAIS